jgi:hypothetical protein
VPRLKRWQWALIVVLLPLYWIVSGFQVFGNVYLGYPPFTPAWLNATKRPLERTVTLARRSSLRVFGTLREGRITLKLNGETITAFVGNFDKRLTLPPGTHSFKLEMLEATGTVNYTLE